MDGVVGGGAPARIWHDFMAGAHRGLPPRPLPLPAPDAPVAGRGPAGETDPMTSLVEEILADG
jgi:membrane peptidoglycan carboxypeptidase